MRLDQEVEYHKKAAELRALVEVEARRLQDATEAKDAVLRQIDPLLERKAKLDREISSLGKEIGEARQDIESLAEKKNEILASTKAGVKELKEKSDSLRLSLKKAQNDLKKLEKTASDIRDYLAEHSHASLALREAEEKLVKTQKEEAKISQKLKNDFENIQKEKKELDRFKDYVKETHSKLGEYVKVAKETIKEVNRLLKENKIPLHFEDPPKTLTFKNFNET